MSSKELDIQFRTKKEISSITEPVCEINRGGKHFISIVGTEIEKRPEEDKKFGTNYRKDEFTDFSLDDKSLEILEHLANTIRLNQPILLEGKTDIGKTRAVEYLSFLANTRLLRISVNGQTDVSELIGKFIPAADRLGFDWANGVVTQAMTWNNGEGCWLYLDELGAAEPQILVKLNPVLEKQPRLMITEKEGEIVTAGPRFRVITSTNPAGPGYAGRNPLARDLFRRFNYVRVNDLDEKTLYKRLTYIFRGEADAEKIARVLTEFHVKANTLLKDMMGDQRQQFEFEYSDLVRLKEFVESSPEEDLVEVLRSGVLRYYCAKLLTEEQRGKIEGQLMSTLTELHITPDTKRKPRASKVAGVAFQIKQETRETGIEQTVQLIKGLIEELPEETRKKIIPPLKRNLLEEAGLKQVDKTSQKPAGDQGIQKSGGSEGKKEEEKSEILIPLVILQGWKIDEMSTLEALGGVKLSEVNKEELEKKRKEWVGFGSKTKGVWFRRRVAQELGWLDNFHPSAPDVIPYIIYSPAGVKIKILPVPFGFVKNNLSLSFGNYNVDTGGYFNSNPGEIMLIACGKRITWTHKFDDKSLGLGWLSAEKTSLGNLVAKYAVEITKETGILPLDLKVLLSAWEEEPVIKDLIDKFGGLEGMTSKKGKLWEAFADFVESRKAKGEDAFNFLFG